MVAKTKYKVAGVKKEMRCRVCGKLLHSSGSREAGICSRCEYGNVGYFAKDHIVVRRGRATWK
jgi:hypothetical protein